MAPVGAACSAARGLAAGGGADYSRASRAHPSMRRSPTLGLVLGLAAVTIFGGSLPSTRLAVAGLDPWFVTAGRAAIGGVVALIVVLAERPRFPQDRLGALALISLCLVIGFPALLAFASLSVPAAHCGVGLGLLPLA